MVSARNEYVKHPFRGRAFLLEIDRIFLKDVETVSVPPFTSPLVLSFLVMDRFVEQEDKVGVTRRRHFAKWAASLRLGCRLQRSIVAKAQLDTKKRYQPKRKQDIT